MEDYNERSKQLLLEMAKQKQLAEKRLLLMEWVITVFSVILLLGMCAIAGFVPMQNWIRVLLIVIGFVLCLIGLGFAIRVEQVAGYFRCGRCGHRYVPTFFQVLCTMHVGRTRYMKCPKCHRRSWSKKELDQEKE